MEYRKLGKTDVDVSVICLGTMTWGEQNTEAEAHEQMDYALDQEVNFWDAAEMYPVPPKSETQGRTEQYIGTWMASRKKRDQVILATKVAGCTDGMPNIRPGQRLDRKNIVDALDNSLKRLRTDYVDLYQLHWPDRDTNFFGSLAYQHNPNEPNWEPFAEVLSVLGDLIQAGKIRHIGCSNETPWGLMHYLNLAQYKDLPRMVSIQNPYSLLNRSYEVGLAEISIREQCGLLAYSPMAFGMLSGKYRHGAKPPKGRITLFERFARYSSPRAHAATEEYCQIAEAHGLTPAQMSLAFVNQQEFVTSNIIGATTMDQLRENIGSIEVTLSPEIIQAIEAVHDEFTYPCP